MARRKATQSSYHGILFFSLLLISFVIMQSASGSAGAALRQTTAGFYRALLSPFQFIPRSLNLWEENSALQQELMRLNLELMYTHEARRENDRIHQLLDLPRQEGFELIPATVLTREQAGFTHRLLINRGSRSGIQNHDPVVSIDGLIGKVVEVTASTAQVILLNDPSFRARVRLNNNQVEGMLAYDYDRHTYLMKNVPLSTEITLGDTVVTAGLESLFPPGLPVGVVSEFAKTTGLFWEVSLHPLPVLEAVTTVGVLHRSGSHELD